MTNRARADVNALAKFMAKCAWKGTSANERLDSYFAALERLTGLFCEFSQIEDPQLRRDTAERHAMEYLATVMAK